MTLPNSSNNNQACCVRLTKTWMLESYPASNPRCLQSQGDTLRTAAAELGTGLPHAVCVQRAPECKQMHKHSQVSWLQAPRMVQSAGQPLKVKVGQPTLTVDDWAEEWVSQIMVSEAGNVVQSWEAWSHAREGSLSRRLPWTG